MDVLGFLAVGAAFLLVLSLLTGNSSADDVAPTAPVQFIIQTLPQPATQEGGPGLGVLIVFILLLFFFLMVQAPNL